MGNEGPDRAIPAVPLNSISRQVLRVYRIPRSTNVERVALAAGHKGLEIEWVDVDPADRSPVIETSGQPLVPVLVHEGGVVHDSSRIIRWLEEQVPDPPLFPSEPARRAEAELFVDWFDRVWKRPPNLIAETLEGDHPQLVQLAGWSGEMAAALDRFEALLDGREYLLGGFGVADCSVFPFLKYALLGMPPDDDELFHRVLVEHQPLGEAHPRLAAWIRRVDQHPRA
jgi:glutathione S-transferase